MWIIGSLSGKGEDCEELSERMIDVCCLQEVRLEGQSSRMLGKEGRAYKFWWSGDGVGGVGVMMKEELCEKVVEARRVGVRVMAVVLVFEEGCADADLWDCFAKLEENNLCIMS